MPEEIKEQLDRIEQYSLLAAKQMLSIDEVALLLNLSKSRIYQLTCKHEIPYYKPNGKLIYFEKEEIENWMRRNRISTNEELDQNAQDYCVRNSGVR